MSELDILIILLIDVFMFAGMWQFVGAMWDIRRQIEIGKMTQKNQYALLFIYFLSMLITISTVNPKVNHFFFGSPLQLWR